MVITHTPFTEIHDIFELLEMLLYDDAIDGLTELPILYSSSKNYRLTAALDFAYCSIHLSLLSETQWSSILDYHIIVELENKEFSRKIC